MNISRWSSRRRLFSQDFYFPLFGTCLEILTSFLNEKYSEFTYKEFIYNVLKRGNPKLLEIPFANDRLPQTDLEEFKVEGYMDSRHKEEPFLWDYNFIHDRLDPLLRSQFISQDEENGNVMLKRTCLKTKRQKNWPKQEKMHIIHLRETLLT